MNEAMKHRGPDGRGVWCDDARSVFLGHVRLAIIDTSDAALQPMVSGNGRYVMVYNGECYNFRDLRRILEAEGCRFRSQSDTEVVLEWVASRGIAGLAEIKGMFAFAFWDDREQSLLLVRDRFGIKPLYYAERPGGRLLFASEVRALPASGLIERRVRVEALVDYLLYGFVIEPETIVAGVAMLRAGTWLRWRARGGKAEQGTFFSGLSGRPDGRVSLPEMRERFVGAVESHLVSDVPLGAFLSGGVDSSAVVGAMSKSRGAAVKTLTVTFPDAVDYSEGDHARRWARKCGTDHTEVPLTGEDLLRLLPRALSAQDQPTVDGVNTFVVSRAARDAGLTVALSGLGGDELFGGYPSFRDVPRALRWRSLLGGLGPLLGRAAEGFFPPFHRQPAKIADLLQAPPELADMYAARRRLFSPFQCAKLYPGFAPSPRSSFGIDSHAADLHPLDRVSLLEQTFYMRNQLLRDSDSMSMACSLEIRVPFLDADFVETAWAAGASGARRQAHFRPGPGWPGTPRGARKAQAGIYPAFQGMDVRAAPKDCRGPASAVARTLR